MDQIKIGNFLKELRKKKALTQEQLAEKFNVSSRTVSRWENGNNMPDISILVELSEFYDVDIREIIDGERKSENMNEQMKDTLIKVAEYTAAEKEKLLKQLLTNMVVSFFALSAADIAMSFNIGSDDMSFMLIFIGIIMSGASILNILQIKGSLNKDKVNTLRRIAIPVCIMLFAAAVLTVLLLVGIL